MSNESITRYVWPAVIVATTSVVVALIQYVLAPFVTRSELQESISNLEIVTAGAVTDDGRETASDFDVKLEQAGQYRVTFMDWFKEPPHIIATTDGGQRGAAITVKEVKQGSFLVETRDYSANGLTPAAFQFIAVGKKEQ
jgi:hypothetical protein